jgi:hypothetical protein
MADNFSESWRVAHKLFLVALAAKDEQNMPTDAEEARVALTACYNELEKPESVRFNCVYCVLVTAIQQLKPQVF